MENYTSYTIVESSKWGCDYGTNLNQVTFHSYENINNKYNLLIINSIILTQIRHGVDIGIETETGESNTSSTFVFYNDDKYILLGYPLNEDEVISYIKNVTNNCIKFNESYFYEYDDIDIGERNKLEQLMEELLKITESNSTEDLLHNMTIEKKSKKHLEDLLEFYNLMLNNDDFWGSKYPNYDLYMSSYPEEVYIEPKFKYDMEYWCNQVKDRYGDTDWELKTDEWYDYFLNVNSDNINKRVIRGIKKI